MMTVKVKEVLETRNIYVDETQREIVFKFLANDESHYWAIGWLGDYYCAKEDDIDYILRQDWNLNENLEEYKEYFEGSKIEISYLPDESIPLEDYIIEDDRI